MGRVALILATMAGLPITIHAEGSLWQALTGGKPDLYLRYRFEYVDDDTPGLDQAYANTLRTALGYSTGLFYNVGLHLQLEDVRAVDDGLYNDGGSNGVTERALVADPEGTEVQQANIRFEGVPNTLLRVGRQEIVHREWGPLQRFVSNVPWRQNWQSFDGARAVSQYVPNTVADYAYIWNVNRVFGEDNPLPDRSDFRIDGHLINVQYKGLFFGRLESYAYLLDFESTTAERFSTQTYGLRFDGSYPLFPALKLLYAGEFANQTDYGDNRNDIDVNYYLGELGVSYTVGKRLDSVTLMVSYEVLGGDGGIESFQTPLATPHPFQGWADRFVITPGDGVQDFFVTLKASLLGANFMAMYHEFNADHDDYDYGTEWDLLIEKPFMGHYVLGLKMADYNADQNSLNVFRNSASGQAFDLTKYWIYVQLKF